MAVTFAGNIKCSVTITEHQLTFFGGFPIIAITHMARRGCARP
jgi:hypothetical protein